MATALELLQDALDLPTHAATGGSATSVVDGGAPYTADNEIGNVVVFDGNITPGLAGVEARVISNSTTALNFAAGDLPEPDAPRGNVYGESRNVQDALLLVMARLRASLDATLDINIGTDTFTVTFDTLADSTGSAGNDVGIEFVVPTLAASPSALGVAYVAARRTLVVSLGTDAGGLVDASNVTAAIAGAIDSTAEFAAASAGTEVATEEIAGPTPHGAGRYVFSGGTSVDDHKRSLQPEPLGTNVILSATRVRGRDVFGDELDPPDPSADTYSQVEVDLHGAKAPSPDFFKGRVLHIPGQGDRQVISSNGTQLLVVPRYDFGSSPASAAYELRYRDDAGGPHLSANAHPGAQGGGNVLLADLLELVEQTITNSTAAY
jgi:hypothetical protein